MKYGLIALTAALVMLATPALAGPPDPCGGSPDTDGDGVCDLLDNCTLVANAGAIGCDTDNDGYGNACDADFNQSGGVTAIDFAAPYFLTDFTAAPPLDGGTGTDMNCSGGVTAIDFAAPYFLSYFTAAPPVPGPSGLPCAGTPGCGSTAGN
jgi:hypothetical protein